MELPIIDVSDHSEENITRLFNICKNVGFFYLKGHNIEQHEIDQVFTKCKEIFNLSEETKLKYKVDKNNRGYVPFYDEVLDPSKQKLGDTKEGFYFGKEVAIEDEGKVPLHAPNKWPQEVSECKDVISSYMEKLQCISRSLLKLLGCALNLGEEYFFQHFSDPTIYLHPCHYLPTVSTPEEGVFAAGAHTDYGMVTLLLTDDVPGLQIYPRGDSEVTREWFDVPPVPGAFIVNLGDVLERWTNGMFKSTLHRVMNKSGRERYSLPFFFEPNFSCMVECLPQFCSDENPASFPSTTFGDYLQYKYLQTHSNYAGLHTSE